MTRHTLSLAGLALMLLGAASCGKAEAALPSFRTLTIQASSLDGVATANCPAGTVLTGGGCVCQLKVVGTYPAPNSPASWLCACERGDEALAYAICAQQ